MLPPHVIWMLAKGASAASGLALSAATAGAAVVGGIGSQVLKASVAAGKTASRVSFTFIQGGIEAVRANSPEGSQQPKIELLTRPLNIVNNGLSIPASFSENQFKKIKCDITDDLTIIKGQNELLFLSNSIRYFVESHVTRTGVDRGISHALQ